MAKQPTKISQIERLQIQKIKLTAEADSHLQALNEQWDYLQDNFGSLVWSSSLQAVRSKLPPVFASLLPSQEEKHKDKKIIDRKSPGLAITAGTLFDIVLDAIPFFLKGRKPVIVAYALRELKNLLFKKN
ncbi:MAG: hypothetical protein LBU57_06320 [Dysgonamonadaceae bacterium]|jgi:hypothetical protein|nr:hypothetical protein [Dysgonamonadaceae bacterium]